MNEVIELFNYLNQSGSAIPISVVTTASTNWTQFALTIAVSGFMLFWIFGSMFQLKLSDMKAKIKLYFIKFYTKRHILFIKHTQQSLFSASMIDQKTLRDITKAIIKFKGKPFDLIIHTGGGEVFSSEHIGRIFKNYPNKIRAVIPIYAMSGGTLLALSCDEIYMGHNSCIGAIDPQLGSLFKYGSAKSWDKIVKFKGNKAEDQTISFAFMGKQYTKTIRNIIKESIKLRMSEQDKNKFVNFITNGDIEHAFPITKSDLLNMKVPIKSIDNKNLMEKMLELISNDSLEGVHYV
jgi:ClpP class serine protease